MTKLPKRHEPHVVDVRAAIQPRAVGFSEIEFGMTAAENEKLEHPELLLSGFLDPEGSIESLTRGSKFLVLGPKGSGKSAIAARLELLSDPVNTYSARTFMLEDFPFKSFFGVLPGTESYEVRLPNHWEFILLMALMDSYVRDQKHASAFVERNKALLDGLAEAGLLPVADLRSVVKTTTESKFRARIPNILEYERKNGSEEAPSVHAMHRALQEAVYEYQSPRLHLIIIDGLDDVLTGSEKQFQALAALIVASDRINRRLAQKKCNAKFILLCRTDLFNHLDDPNTNKIKQDHSIVLDWFQDQSDLKDSRLVQVLDLRASLAAGRSIKTFIDLFDCRSVYGKPPVQAILENTRHRPRDMLQAMKHIQQVTTTKKVLEPHVEAGLKQYAKAYFVPELKNELSGFLRKEEIAYALTLIQSLHSRRFTYGQLQAAHKKLQQTHQTDFDLSKLVTALYETSVLGNTFEGGSDGREYVKFRYRNPHSDFNPNENLILHYALSRGLNIPIATTSSYQ